MELIKRIVKQLVKLYEDNNRLLSGKLTLLSDDYKIPIFLLFSRNI